MTKSSVGLAKNLLISPKMTGHFVVKRTVGPEKVPSDSQRTYNESEKKAQRNLK